MSIPSGTKDFFSPTFVLKWDFSELSMLGGDSLGRV